MIKFQSRSHYTLLILRSGNESPKTEPELGEISNQQPSTIRRALDVLERHALVEETTAERKGKTVPAYKITRKGVETLYLLAREQTRHGRETDYNYDRMLERQASYRRARREAATS